jgi:hypothetical protein
MKLKKQLILFCLITVIGIPFNNLLSQSTQTKPGRQSSIEAFSQANYEKAYAGFRELLLTYPKDPLYKYYSAVCLVKLNRDPVEAANLLQEALQGGGAVKTLPSDALFYLGRAQQMSGKFREAEESYKLYTDQVGKKAAKEMAVPGFIQQCKQKEGQVSNSETKPFESSKTQKADSNNIGTKYAIKDQIKKNVEIENPTKVNLPSDYEIFLNEAIEFQFKADSLLELAGEQRKEMEKASTTEKATLKARISENEKLASSFQTNADQKYQEAQRAENQKPDSVIPLKETAGQTENKVVKDTSKKADNKIAKAADIKSDTIKGIKSQVEIFSFFEALPKPITDKNAQIVIDPEVPEGLIYRIQIAVFRNPVVPAYFKGITPVYGFKIAGTDKTIYYAGMFRKSADAKKALTSVKSKGFKDSFIIALAGNKAVSPDRATLMEKEWGQKPFYSIDKALPETRTDTITPTLSFRVEVIRSLKPMTQDVVDGIRKMAGNRGMDILFLQDGKIVYLIGKFITFESAAEYADLLNRNGYHEAVVVAWLGKKEISVETARQLFDNLK